MSLNKLHLLFKQSHLLCTKLILKMRCTLYTTSLKPLVSQKRHGALGYFIVVESGLLTKGCGLRRCSAPLIKTLCVRWHNLTQSGKCQVSTLHMCTTALHPTVRL